MFVMHVMVRYNTLTLTPTNIGDMQETRTSLSTLYPKSTWKSTEKQSAQKMNVRLHHLIHLCELNISLLYCKAVRNDHTRRSSCYYLG